MSNNVTLKTVLNTRLAEAVNAKGKRIVGKTHGERFAALRNLLWPVSQEMTDRRDVEAYSLAARLSRTTVDNIYDVYRPVAKAIMKGDWNTMTVRDGLNLMRSAMYRPEQNVGERPVTKPEVKPAAPQQSELDKILASLTPDTDMRKFNHHPMRLEILAHRNMLREALAPDVADQPVVTAKVEAAQDIRERKVSLLQQVVSQNETIARQNAEILALIRSL